MVAIEQAELTVLAESIRREHELCREAFGKGLQHAIECGRLLAEAKAQCAHGEWLPWLAENTGIPERTAQAYMRLFQRRGLIDAKAQHVADLPMREALALLAEPREDDEPIKRIPFELVMPPSNGNGGGVSSAPYVRESGATSGTARDDSGDGDEPEVGEPITDEVAESILDRFEREKHDELLNAGIHECYKCGKFYRDGDTCPHCGHSLWDELPEEAPAAHQLINSSQSNEWYTPAAYIEAARRVLGGIDLDPASCETANKVVKAKTFYTTEDDGFNQPWYGRVFLNPPYGRDEDGSNQARWSAKLVDEYRAGNVKAAILLVNAVTGERWFSKLWDFPICFTDHRIKFYNTDGEYSQPTHSNAFVYLGDDVAAFVAAFKDVGVVARRIDE